MWMGGMKYPGVKVLVEFEGVRDVVCLKENKIYGMKLYYITCQPNCQEGGDRVGDASEYEQGKFEDEGHENSDWNLCTALVYHP